MVFAANSLVVHAGLPLEWIKSPWRKINMPPPEEVFMGVKTEMVFWWRLYCITGHPSMETVSIHPHLPCQVLAFCSILALIAQPAHMSAALLGPRNASTWAHRNRKKWSKKYRKRLNLSVWIVLWLNWWSLTFKLYLLTNARWLQSDGFWGAQSQNVKKSGRS